MATVKRYAVLFLVLGLLFCFSSDNADAQTGRRGQQGNTQEAQDAQNQGDQGRGRRGRRGGMNQGVESGEQSSPAGRRGGQSATNQQTNNPNEKMVRIIAVRNNQITVVESTGGSGRGRGQMRGGSSESGSTSQGRRGRGRRGGRMGTQGTTPNVNNPTITLTNDIRLTTAIKERRTNDIRVGADINGRLRNSMFKTIPNGGLPARIVTDGNRIIEINVIQENDTSLEDIAVKPKRPPMKR